jgi:arsenical pump membrane protein
MLIVHFILAALAVGGVALGPGRALSAVAVAGAATVDIALGAAAAPALAAVAPLLVFLAAALTLAALVERSGLAERAARSLARAAHGSMLRLYVLVCVLCALLTAVVSLDGAVVLMVPLLLALVRDARAPLAPHFLGVVAVANAASIAVPQGNPTNLVVMNQLGLSPTAFLAHMLAPGLAATVICAGGVALRERRLLSQPYSLRAAPPTPLSSQERHAVLALAAAACAAWGAPLLGLAPWWPFAGVVAIALALHRQRPHLLIPWRLAIQLAGLVVVTRALALHASLPATPALPGLAAAALGIGAVAAIVNNLPASVWATALLAAGPAAYAASIGLAVGALATPQGSVATLLAGQLTGPGAPAIDARRFAPLAAAAVIAATLVLWATL